MISRSKSAPQAVDSLQPRTPAHLVRSSTLQSLSTPAPVRLTTPWEAREEPFNLVRFFPSRLAETLSWDWIGVREEEINEEEEDKQYMDEPGTYQDYFELSMAGQAKRVDGYDEFARQVIDGEDKFGKLALSSGKFTPLARLSMPTFERAVSPVHVSPLVVDEPLDLDALYMKHCLRREMVIGDEEGEEREVGQLFFCGEEEGNEGGWLDRVYGRLLELSQSGYQRVFERYAKTGAVG